MIKLTASGVAGTYYAVDVSDIRDFLDEAHDDHYWLPKVNSFEVRLDGEIGRGYILVSKTAYDALKVAATGITLTFNDGTTDVTHIAYLEDAIVLDHATGIGHTPLVVMILREERSILQEYAVQDDFNVIDLNTYTDVTSFSVFNPASARGPVHGTPYTWTEIIDLVVTQAGLTLYNPGTDLPNLPTETPYNVYLCGLTAFDALQYIGSILGFGFTVQSGIVYFTLRAPDHPAPSNSYIVEANTAPDPKIPVFNLMCPDLEQQADNQYIANKFHKFGSSDTGDAGYNIAVQCPFYPYMYGYSGNNTTTLNSVAATIQSNLESAYQNRVSHVNVHGTFEAAYRSKSCDVVQYYDDGDTLGTRYANFMYDFKLAHVTPKSQSIEPFYYTITTAYDPLSPTTGQASISSPDGDSWGTVRIMDLFNLGKDSTTQAVGETGEGMRVGLRRFTLGAGSGGSSTPQPIQFLYCTLGTRGSAHFAADPRETDAIINTGSVVRLSSDPFSVSPDLSAGTVPNTLKLTGITGDGAIIQYNYTTGAYFLAHVYPQQQLEVWCTLAADAPYGSLQPTVSMTPVTPIGIGAMPSNPFDAEDTYFQAINAKAGHRALVKYNYEDSKYHIIACEHIAIRVRGQVNGTTFNNRPSTVTIDNLQGLDGLTPTDSPFTATNRYGWEAFDDNENVEVHWDNITGSWYIAFGECPADPTPTYF